jgi:ribosomal protein L40E
MTARRYLGAFLILLAVLFIVVGTRECGPVARGKPIASSILRGDTVPATQQNGDSTQYRYECTRSFTGSNWPYSLLAVAFLLVGVGLLAFPSFTGAPVVAEKVPAKTLGRTCRACGTVNAADARTCVKCGYALP